MPEPSAASVRESREAELRRLIRWAENATHFGPEDFAKLSRLAHLAKALAHV